MFDVSFSELMVIAIVALVVIGPERLPRVARTAGLLFGRLQRYVNDVKSDISREIQLDELKRLQSEMQESARSFERSMNEGIQSIEQTVQHTVDSTQSELNAVAAEASAATSTSESETPTAPVLGVATELKAESFAEPPVEFQATPSVEIPASSPPSDPAHKA